MNLYDKTKSTTPEDLETILLNWDLCTRRVAKKIKVTTPFYYYLLVKCRDNVVCKKDDSARGYHDSFIGIPIEIDDDIENEYYELVY